ncbi:MAG: hypothetical protein IJL25_03690 [Clostridia bacterium]|nr:hypothetical protein [Clostridia bacterium]
MNRPVNILHGTDWWTDCDDVAALRLLCRAHRAGKINLCCVGIDSVMQYSAPSVSAFLQSEGVEAPIGVDFSAVRSGDKCRYQKLLASYPHTVQANIDCIPAYRLYRKTLAGIDGRAQITEVGFPQIIMQLMQSDPDEFSPLSGMELVKEKVEKIWLMAGRWDRSPGREYNLTAYPACSAAGHYICEHSPVPLVFLGYEAGMDVITGNTVPEDDLLKKAFNANGAANGRSSWDPMLVSAAITQDLAEAGYAAVYGRAHVDPATGDNTFTRGEGNHCYLVKTRSDAFYADSINKILSARISEK